MKENNIKPCFSLKELCEELSISHSTGKNWIKLGKISPDINDNMFSEEYLYNLKNNILQNKNTLKNRRNKNFISGNQLYEYYLENKTQNAQNIENLLSYIENNKIPVTEDLICNQILDCATQFLKSRDLSCSELIKDIKNLTKSQNKINLHQKYKYIAGEDTLGLLCISLKSISKRKSLGAYYTPTKIVKKLCHPLFDKQDLKNKSVYDPCCGTGNFLINLPDDFNIENIYGTDIDLMSVLITRINLALKYKIKDVECLYNNIKVQNYLEQKSDKKYDYILGNPPWGYNFSDLEKKLLKTKFKSAKGTSVESYDVILEKALSDLSHKGILSFLLPEAILNVKSHTNIRNFILENFSITYVEYLGEVFQKVQCPCVILQITNNKFSTYGINIIDKDNKYKILTKRDISAQNFNFRVTDYEY